MPNLSRLVADGHLVEDDAIGPHVHSWRDPSVISHLRSLVVLSTHYDIHVGHLAWGIDYVAQTEVADFSDRTLLNFLLVRMILLAFLEDKNVVYLDVSVDYTTLMYVAYALQDVLSPDG